MPNFPRPDFVPIPAPPSPHDLVRFFRTRRSFPIDEAARLLGWVEPRLAFDLQEEGSLLPGGEVAWADVASRLLLAWPRPWLLDSLGTKASLLPDGLHLVAVHWMLPRYVVLAMGVQARLRYAGSAEVHTTDVAHYIADVLHLAIEPETAEALRGREEFVTSFHFPHDVDGDGE